MHAVIIGGGIVGLASAYYLRRRGVEATVFEQGPIGNGSTPRAGGGIRAQFSTPTSIALSRASIEVWERFGATFAADIDYRKHGYLYLARTEETAAAIRESVAFHNDHGVPSEFVDPETAKDHCPGIDADNYVGATHCPTDGYADPERALQGFALAAAREGAEINIGRRVADVAVENGQVTGVETGEGHVGADFVVNAAGAWSKRVAAMAGVDLDITPERRQLMLVEPATPVEPDAPFVTDLDTGAYFRPKDAEIAYVGGHFAVDREEADPDTFRRDHEDGWAETALAEAADVAAYFGPGAAIKRGWAGLYAMTPDHHPIIEEVVPGFVVAAGFSGHGFMQSPATGRLVAELVADGEASLVDISKLTADRFERGEGLHEVFYSA